MFILYIFPLHNIYSNDCDENLLHIKLTLPVCDTETTDKTNERILKTFLSDVINVIELLLQCY